MWHLVRDQTSSALIIVIHHEERVHIHTLIHDQIGLNSSNSHDYTLQHRALTERWIHPIPRGHQELQKQVKLKLKCVCMVRDPVRSDQCPLKYFLQKYIHIKNQQCPRFKMLFLRSLLDRIAYTVFLFTPNLDRLINTIIKY